MDQEEEDEVAFVEEAAVALVGIENINIDAGDDSSDASGQGLNMPIANIK